MPEGLTPERGNARVQKLTKRASLYLEMAEGAAKAINGDADLIVLRLFENTSYQVTDDVSDEKIASMAQIRELLAGMADAAMRRNDLRHYQEILGSQRIGWDIDGSFGNYCSLAGDVFFRDRMARHVSYLGYAPTVLLYRRDVGPTTPVKGQAFQIDFEKDPDAVKRLLFEGGPVPKKYQMPVSLSIYREVWFGIGPIETDWTWKPIFEKRLSFEIRGHQGSARSLHVRSYDPTIVHASEMHGMDGPNRLQWLHQFSLLPRKPSGASLSFDVSPHIDTSEMIGSEDVRREHIEDQWLVALDRFDDSDLSVDEDIEAAKGQFSMKSSISLHAPSTWIR